MEIYKKNTILSLCIFSYACITSSIFLVLFVCFHFTYLVYLNILAFVISSLLSFTHWTIFSILIYSAVNLLSLKYIILT